MIITAAKSILVQLCYFMTREISSTFSIINRQTSIPTEKCFKLVQKPRGRVGKRKNNLNGISTTYSSSSISMKTSRLFWVSWIIVTGPFIKIVTWRPAMLRMSTPEPTVIGVSCCGHPALSLALSSSCPFFVYVVMFCNSLLRRRSLIINKWTPEKRHHSVV